MSRVAYVSIGGGDGEEIECALNSGFQRGILLEVMDWAADRAKERAQKLNESGKELVVLTGDAAQKLEICGQHLDRWRNLASAPVTGLLISAQAVLHELPDRADPRKFNFKKIFALFDGFDTAIFHSREPTLPGIDTGWRKSIELFLPGIQGPELVSAAKLIRDRFKDRFSRDINLSQEFCGDIFSVGNNWVHMPGLVAVELLHKLLRFSGPHQLRHEMEECLVALDPSQLQTGLTRAMGGKEFTKVEPTVTGGFQGCYLSSGVQAREAEAEKSLPCPLAFSFITAFKEHRTSRSTGNTSPIALPGSYMREQPTLITVVVKRSRLFDKFLAYAIKRDVVFALGGVGSGLKTFLDQFQKESVRCGAKTYHSSVDFNIAHYTAIRNVRLAAGQEDPRGAVHLELKCLLTALAYEVFCRLRKESPNTIQSILDHRWLVSAVTFADYYFGKSPSFTEAATEPIVRFFFETIQEAAKLVAGTNVIVFMPLEKLASCYICDGGQTSDNAMWEIGRSLWNALDTFGGTPGEFDKVCLVVASRQFPYAHSNYTPNVVGKSLWCLPPLDTDETEDLLKQVNPTLAGTDASRLLLDATGGSPWFTSLVLSFLPLTARMPEQTPSTGLAATALIRQSIQSAQTAMTNGGKDIKGPLGDIIRTRIGKMARALGKGHADDVEIVEKWREPVAERRVYRITSPKFENFVAAGLVWLEGDPWICDTEESIFFEYPPTVRLRSASHIALATYEHLTDARLV